MSKETAEDREILDFLDQLAEEPETGSANRSLKAESRAWLETFGLLPYGLQPMSLSPQVKERLMSAIEGTAADSGREPAVLSFDREAGRRAASPSGISWVLPLAAVLILTMAALFVWQSGRISEQERTIASLANEVERLRTTTVSDVNLATNLRQVESKLQLITSSGVEVCTLQPTGDHALTAAARGVLYVAADHQHWYLSLEGLKPCPEGRIYQVWFHTGEGPVSAGTVPVTANRIELASATMPAGTQSVSVTLEPPEGSPQPSGPPLLYGDQVMRIL